MERKTEKIRLILFDLDETLLRRDKTISEYSEHVLRRCRAAGLALGFVTARGEISIERYVKQLEPELVIASGGASIRYCGELLYTCMFTPEETNALILAGRRVKQDCEITVDTLEAHYWDRKGEPLAEFADWNASTCMDFERFRESALKVCVEVSEEAEAREIAASVPHCRWVRFSDIPWYQFSKAESSKAAALAIVSERLVITPEEMLAFGDDFGDIDMLRYCGMGVAVANAIVEVKEIADAVTEADNEHDGVAQYLERLLVERRLI